MVTQAPVTQLGSVEAILNSTRREVDEHNNSSASNRSRVADDELLLELRAMNRNIPLLVENAVDDKARMQCVENILNVSASLINTSLSISKQLHIMQSNHVIYCNTQGRPIHTNANSPAQQYTMSAQQPAAQLWSSVCPTYSDPVSMGAMRSDPALHYGATVRLQERENSV
jgi:hypothetical protein